MKIALVHESLTPRGGAERVFDELRRAFPEADALTLDANTFLRRLPRKIRERRTLLPLHAAAPETLDLSSYDVVLSSASAFAKGVITRPGTLHVAYLHAPTRYLWDLAADVADRYPHGTMRRGMLLLSLHTLRLWDTAAARRADLLIANSETTRARIQKYYGRDSAVIYPPVRLPSSDSEGSPTPFLRPSRVAPAGAEWEAQGEATSPRSYFLFVGRLSPYKNARLAIQTFNKLELPLVIVGDGRERKELGRLIGKTITFRGQVPDDQLPAIYRGARAVIFPSDDDFGIVPVEAMASGTPVLALRKGGATETVLEGVTGEFFDEPMEELLADCVRRFLEKELTYDPEVLRRHAARFSADRFRTEIRGIVERVWAERRMAATPLSTSSLRAPSETRGEAIS